MVGAADVFVCGVGGGDWMVGFGGSCRVRTLRGHEKMLSRGSTTDENARGSDHRRKESITAGRKITIYKKQKGFERGQEVNVVVIDFFKNTLS